MSHSDLISAVNENTWIVYLGEEISDTVAMRVKYLHHWLAANHASHILDSVPSYTSILVTFNVLRVDRFDMRRILNTGLNATNSAVLQDEDLETITIPVCYDVGAVNDLGDVAEHCQLTKQAVIDLHVGTRYRVYAIGFSPGFGFLGNTPKEIYVPRKTTPRLKVPTGSVALADNQTAVYPSESPGGWQVIGRTYQSMVDWSAKELSYLKMGYQVQFEPISESEYLSKGGSLS